jgi:Dolichyl-phosphate-mannose-protein mannosyltransferase
MAITGTLGTCEVRSSQQQCRIPETSLQERYIVLLLIATSCWYLRFFRSYTTLHSDEGIVLEGAQRILEGQVLYRDFFSFYTPGSYYWTALLFKVFGNSILVPRAALVVYGGVFSALTYLLARRACSRSSSLLATCLALVVSLPYSFYVQHSWDSSLLALLTIYCAVRFLEMSGHFWAFAAGSFAALTVLFEHSKGAGLIIGLAGGWIILALSKRRASMSRSRWLTLAAAFVWPFLVTFAYFGSQQAIGPMLADWLWPLHHYSQVNRVNYGYLHLSSSQWNTLHSGSWIWRLFAFFVISPTVIICVLPFLTIGVLVWQAVALLTKECDENRPVYCVLVGAALIGLWLPVVALRPDLAHIVYLTPLFAISGAWILDGRDLPLKLLHDGKSILIWYLVGSFATFGIALLLNPLGAQHRLVTRRGSLKSSEPENVISYIDQHVPPQTKIFVYPYQPLYYYLTRTSNPTSYEYLQPGMHTAEQTQQVTQQLEHGGTLIALFTPSFRDFIAVSWPNTPLAVIAARDPIANYLLAHYRVCTILNSGSSVYWYMLRKGLPCPEASNSAPAIR